MCRKSCSSMAWPRPHRLLRMLSLGEAGSDSIEVSASTKKIAVLRIRNTQNMSCVGDEDALREAYEDVRKDDNAIAW